jgi:hypothetical protein
MQLEKARLSNSYSLQSPFIWKWNDKTMLLVEQP